MGNSLECGAAVGASRGGLEATPALSCGVLYTVHTTQVLVEACITRQVQCILLPDKLRTYFGGRAARYGQERCVCVEGKRERERRLRKRQEFVYLVDGKSELTCMCIPLRTCSLPRSRRHYCRALRLSDLDPLHDAGSGLRAEPDRAGSHCAHGFLHHASQQQIR